MRICDVRQLAEMAGVVVLAVVIQDSGGWAAYIGGVPWTPRYSASEAAMRVALNGARLSEGVALAMFGPQYLPYCEEDCHADTARHARRP